MKKEITLPDWVSIKQWSKIEGFSDLEDTERAVRIIGVITDTDEDEVRRWNLKDLSKVFAGIQEELFDFTPILFPLIRFKGTIWGMQPISKMQVGEYIDLENAMKRGKIEEIMAIIYRPVTRNDFDGVGWKIRKGIQYITGETETLFKGYDIEEYDSKTKNSRIAVLSELPIGIALGALDFFLSIGLQYKINTILYSEKIAEVEKETIQAELERMLENLSQNTGDGLGYSLN